MSPPQDASVRRDTDLRQFWNAPPIGYGDALAATDTAAAAVGYITLVPLALTGRMRVRELAATIGTNNSTADTAWAMALYKATTPLLQSPTDPLAAKRPPELLLVQGSTKTVSGNVRFAASGSTFSQRFNLVFLSDLELDPAEGQFYVALWTRNAQGLWLCPPTTGGSPLTALRADAQLALSGAPGAFPSSVRARAAATRCPSVTLRSTLGMYFLGSPDDDTGAAASYVPSGITDITLADNTNPAFRIHEATNDYVVISTADGAEKITFGNTNTNPAFVFAGFGTIKPPDASGVDVAGADLRISGGFSTGAGLGGRVSIRSTTAGASSSTVRTAFEVARFGFDSNGAKSIWLGVESSATPTVGLVRGTDASGADTAGADVRICGGAATGSARGGAVVFQSTLAAGSGSSTNTLTTVGTFRWDTTGTKSLWLGAESAASPGTGAVRGTDGSGADVAGADLQILGGAGTGAARGGAVVLRSSPAGASSSTLGTLGTILTARFDTAGDRVVWIGNGESNASPVVGSLRGTAGSGANVAGADLRVSGGASTGSAAGGSVRLRVTPAGGAGSATNAYTDVLVCDSTKLTTLAGGLTASGVYTLSITDNTASVFLVREGSNNYIAITTTNAAETVSFGNTTTNPSYAFLGSGTTTFSGPIALSSISITDNTANAFRLAESTNDYLNVNTTNAGENVSFGNATTNPSFSFLGSGAVSIAGGLSVTGTVTASTFAISDNTSTAFRVREGSNNYIAVDTTNAAETVSFGNTTTNPSYSFLGSGNTTFGGSLVMPTAFFVGSGSHGTLGANAVAIGDASVASGSNGCVAIGASASASATAAIAIKGTASSSLAVAIQGTASSTNAVAVGGTAAAANSIALGTSTSITSPGTSGIAIGNSATVPSPDGIAIGRATTSGNSASGDNVCIGRSNVVGAAATGGVGIGATHALGGTKSVAIGFGAAVNASGGVAIGNAAAAGASQTNGIAIGTSSSANNTSAIAVGNTTTATGANAVSLGPSITNAQTGALVLGHGVASTASGQVVIGGGTTSLTAVYIGNGVTNASPAAVSIQSTGASGANVAGVSTSIVGGASTGSAAGGSVLIRVTPAGGAGSSLNTPSTVATFDSTLLTTLAGGLTANGVYTLTVTDNTANGFLVQEAANAYIAVTTTNASEAMSFGNTSTNPSYAFLGTGVTTFSGPIATSNINITDNLAAALQIREGSNNYLKVVTTNAGENVSFGNATTNPSFSFLGTGAVSIAGALSVTGTVTASTFAISDNTSTAFRVREGGNNYIAIDTTNSAEVLSLGNATTNPSYAFLGSGNTTFGGSLVMPTAFFIGAGSHGSLGTSAIAIGDTASALGQACVAIGYFAVAGVGGGANDFAVAIGNQSSATGYDAVALGDLTTVSAQGGVGLGRGATVSASGGVGLGYSTVVAHKSVAIGAGATTTADGQVVIGSNSFGAPLTDYYLGGHTPIAWLATAQTVTLQPSGITGADKAGGALVLAGGKGTGNAAPGSVLIKVAQAGASGSTLQSLSTIATFAAASLLTTLAGSLSMPSEFFIGGGGHGTLGSNAVAIGGATLAAGTNAIAMGASASAAGADAVSFGVSSGAAGAEAVALGPAATAAGANAVALGYQASSAGVSGFAGGYGSSAGGDYAVALGLSAGANVAEAVALGHSASASGTLGAMALGSTSTASGNGSTAVGAVAAATATGAQAFGAGSTASATSAVALGVVATASGSSSVALGDTVSVTHNYSVGLGVAAASTKAQQLVLLGASHPLLEILVPGGSTTLDVQRRAHVRTTNGLAAVVDSYTLPDNRGAMVQAYIAARDSSGTNYRGVGCSAYAYRSGGGATLTGGGVVNSFSDGTVTGLTWSAGIAVSGNDIQISVTGTALTTIYWSVVWVVVQVGTDT